MTIERTEPGCFTCKVCGQTWEADETTAQMMAELLGHADTHTAPDASHPPIWLR